MNIINPLTGNLTPVASVLRQLASQENCDGEPYDQMIAAAEYIMLLESTVRLQKTRIELLDVNIQMNNIQFDQIDI